MAKKGSITLPGGVVVDNVYLRVIGISGGKHPHKMWYCNVEAFRDGGVAAIAFEQAQKAWEAITPEQQATATPPDPSAMNAVRLLTDFPMLKAPWAPGTLPEDQLYAVFTAANPNFTDA